MQFIEPEICNYTENIWESILGLKVEKTAVQFKSADENKALASCVHIMGAWEGTVALQCPVPLAQQAAATMFGIDKNAVGMEQIQDALGELANMTGGNIKSLLPEPSFLSLPAVAITDHPLHIPGTDVVTTVNFKCDGHGFTVTLMKRTRI